MFSFFLEGNNKGNNVTVKSCTISLWRTHAVMHVILLLLLLGVEDPCDPTNRLFMRLATLHRRAHAAKQNANPIHLRSRREKAKHTIGKSREHLSRSTPIALRPWRQPCSSRCPPSKLCMLYLVTRSASRRYRVPFTAAVTTLMCSGKQ
jgi:hypothetical protein